MLTDLTGGLTRVKLAVFFRRTTAHSRHRRRRRQLIPLGWLAGWLAAPSERPPLCPSDSLNGSLRGDFPSFRRWAELERSRRPYSVASGGGRREEAPFEFRSRLQNFE